MGTAALLYHTNLYYILLYHTNLDILWGTALYPHQKGLPYKHSLKKLAKDFLDKVVQEGEGATAAAEDAPGDGMVGHDSVQDAVIALELALLKVCPV